MDQILFPNYDKSILNLITSILKYYNVKTNHTSLPELDEKLNKKDYKNVVFIVLDGLGECILNKHLSDGFFKSHEICPITSVYPTTTTAALTTYYSGKPPYETGWIGWCQYFKEYGRYLNMFKHTESYEGTPLKKPEVDVFETVVNYKSIFTQIEEASPNVKAYELTPTYAELRGRKAVVCENIDDMLEHIPMLCKTEDKKFILAYSDNPDHILHLYGTDSEEVNEYVKKAQNIVEEISNKVDDDTLIIVSADHGHRNIDKTYRLYDYPELVECLIMPPSLESRALTFWVKDNMKKEFEKRFKNAFGDDFWLMTKEEFLDRHILGYGEKHPKIDDFIGNYMALSVKGSRINFSNYLYPKADEKISTHCGLTKDEMEVPLIVIEK